MANLKDTNIAGDLNVTGNILMGGGQFRRKTF